MTIENITDQFETIATLPQPEKGDGGYKYPPEVVGSLCIYKDKLVMFNESNYDEIQLKLIEAMYSAIQQSVTSDVQEAISISSNTDQLEESVNALVSTMQTQDEQIAELEDNIKQLQNSKPSITLETIQKLIDKKIESSPASTGKVKISTLSMLKESGFEIDEISELARNDLI